MDSRGAAKWVRIKFWPLWWPVSLSIKLYTTLNHIWLGFFTTISRNEIVVLTIENTDSDLRVHALHYANELLVRVRLFQKLLQTRLICIKNSKKCLGKEQWRVLVIDKSTYHEKTTFRFIFYHNINVKEFFFQSSSWKKYCVTHWREKRGRDSYSPR